MSLTLQQSLTLIMQAGTVERENSFSKGKRLQQNQVQGDRPSAEADWCFQKTEADAQKEHRSIGP